MQPYTGKCHCGKNTYTINADPEFQFVCYCKDCRILSASGHLCGMIFDQAQLTEAAHTQTYHFNGGSGQPIIVHFCPICATSLYSYPTKFTGKVVIRANTLNHADFKPQQTLFMESKFDWDPVFETTHNE